MSVFKKIAFVLLCFIDGYFLYATIGYLVLGIQTPKILGGVPTTFMGMYMMSITFFCLLVLTSVIITIMSIRYFKNKNK